MHSMKILQGKRRKVDNKKYVVEKKVNCYINKINVVVIKDRHKLDNLGKK